MLSETRQEQHLDLLGDNAQKPNQDNISEPLTLVDRVLEFEPKYRDDPRYWQLVWYVVEVEDRSSDRDIYIQGIQDQIDRGIATPASMHLLLDSRPTPETEEEIQERIDYFNEIISRYPEMAVFKYYAGANYLNLGETDLAWDQFKVCNQASDTTYPMRYPMTAIHEYYDKFDTPESQFLAGWIMANQPIENYIKRKEDVKIIEVCMAIGLPPGLGDDFYNVLITRGLMERDDAFGAWVNVVLANELLVYCHDELYSLNEEQEQEYQKLHNCLQMLQDEYKQKNADFEYSTNQSSSSWPEPLKDLRENSLAIGQEDFVRVANRQDLSAVCESVLRAIRGNPFTAWANGELIGVTISPDEVRAQLDALAD